MVVKCLKLNAFVVFFILVNNNFFGSNYASFIMKESGGCKDFNTDGGGV